MATPNSSLRSFPFLLFPFIPNMSFVPSLLKLKNHPITEFRVWRTETCKCVGSTPIKQGGRNASTLKMEISNVGELHCEDKWYGYEPYSSADLNDTLLDKVFPHKFRHQKNDYRILRAMTKPGDHLYKAQIIKVILQNKDTGNILLLTSINTKPSERHWDATEEGWYTFRADMVAPLGFWEMLRDCL